MSLFSKKGKNRMSDFKILEVDVHSHLLPGIDDGAKNIEETLKMINKLVDLGFQKLITTPHVASDFFKNDADIILSRLQIIQEAVKQQNIPVIIEAAAEYYFDFELKTSVDYNLPLLTFGSKYILIEFSTTFLPEQFLETFFILQTNGYKPVLAHPERYVYLAQDFEKYEELHDRGILLQLSINSLVDGYGKVVKKISQELIKHNLYSFVGSDSHSTKDLNLMQTVLSDKYFEKLIQSGTLLNATL